ncbi:MAG TPA: polysaccharide deacetylase family protein [Candidatus Saccharimonadia bacterium]|nr:polysaccharide deacetylase family protein [Candidatus Saccharimonadia bacterium]
MKTSSLITSIIHRSTGFTYGERLWTLKHTKKRLLKAYAAWRVGATKDEMLAYRNSGSILLTFDDYGSEDQIDELLHELERERVQAMFFLQGDWATQNPHLVSKVANKGHVIGNHTYSHPDLLALSDDEVRREITTGVTSIWLRPPRGRYNNRIRKIAASLGYRICYWTIDSDDWQGVSGSLIERKVLAELHPGAVILFHIHADETRRILPSLIKSIRDSGFELASMDARSGSR